MIKLNIISLAIILLSCAIGNSLIAKEELEKSTLDKQLSTVSTFPYQESFESNFGLWVQDATDDYDWTRTSGSTPSSGTGPSAASDGSYYLHIEADGHYPNYKAHLISPTFDLSGLQNAVFEIKYHMYGTGNVGQLRFEVSTDNGASWTSLWLKAWNQGNTWHSASINLSAYAGQSIKIRIYTNTSTSNRSDIAIDDIKVSESNTVTSYPYKEGFESGIGLWEQEVTDDNDWTQYSGSTPSFLTGPTGADEGTYYMYCETSSPGGGQADGYPNKSFILNSPSFDLSQAGTANFEFSFHMYGTHSGTLDLEVTTDGTNWITVWTKSGNQDDNWIRESVDLYTYVNNTIQLRFNYVSGNGNTGDVAIDDLEFSINAVVPNISCSNTVTTFPYNEGFESGLGLWAQGINGVEDDLDWTRKSGSTPSSYTGPETAIEGSYYLFTEASGSNANKDFQLISPCFDLSAASQASFSFKYHMYGAHMGSLRIEVFPELENQWIPIWSKTGDQGEQWYQASIDLAAYTNQKIKIRFTGRTGSSYKSDITIDELEVNLQSPTGGTASTIIATYPYFESFENSWGAWSESVSNDIWRRNSGVTTTYNSGPNTALNGVYYMYTEASSPNHPNKTAVLDGPSFDLVQLTKPAAGFYYNMYGKRIGTLRFEVSTNDGSSWTTLWSKSGEQGEGWKYAMVSLENYVGQNVKVRFWSRTGYGNEGDLAIDAFFVSENNEVEDGMISGRIFHPSRTTCLSDRLDGTDVPNVYVDIVNHTDQTNYTFQTGVDGVYSGNISGGDISITPNVYSTNWTTGVTSLDLIALDDHINNTNVIDCPLFRLAGDVENDEDLDIYDLEQITLMVLGVNSSFSAVPNWRLIPASYIKGNTYSLDPHFTGDFWNKAIEDTNGNDYPFKANLNFNDKSYSYSGTDSWLSTLDRWTFDDALSCSTGTWDFALIKMGDLDGSASTAGFTAPPGPIQQIMFDEDRRAKKEFVDGAVLPQNQLEKNERLDKQNNRNKKYNVRIVAQSIEPVKGYQMNIQFNDEILELGKITPNSRDLSLSTAKNFGQAKKTARGGNFKTLWINDSSKNPRGKEFSQSIEIFSFEFQSKEDLSTLRSAISLDSADFEMAFYGRKGERLDVDLQVFIENVK
ncbi:MAG: choice-of-anchor J domain-containing protein [Bacteroidota bacterium]